MAAVSVPVSVNWHISPRCNYLCRFCFATFADIRKVLARDLALRIPPMLRKAGTEKITFAGGEPMLCPHLDAVLRVSKDVGMTTMIVTNGTRLTDEFLAALRGVLDWVTISIDSAREQVERELGRGRGSHVAVAREAARRVRSYGIRLKVNTVVTSRNWTEDMHELIRDLKPERWKVFQILPIDGENDSAWDLLITREQFQGFLDRHRDLNPVGEDNDAMTESYIMLDPLGRFFQNTGGRYHYSSSILDLGVVPALQSLGWDQEKFLERGGLYDWAPNANRSGEAPIVGAEGRLAEC